MTKNKNEETSTNFRKRHLVFIDLETTGLDVTKHEIVEIGCMIVNGDNFQIVEEYSAKVRPEHIETASKEALEINGYTKEKWHDSVKLRTVIEKVFAMTKGGMISGWNVAFDWAFIEAAFRKLKIESNFNYHKVDVQAIAYAKLYHNKKITSLKLRSIASHFGYELGNVHGAPEDIRITYEVFKKLMDLDEKYL